MVYWCTDQAIMEQPLDLSASAAEKTTWQRLDRLPPEAAVDLNYHHDTYRHYDLHNIVYTTQESRKAPTEEADSIASNLIGKPCKAATVSRMECGASPDPDPQYAAFRAAMLEAIMAKHGGKLTGSNPRMRRSVRGSDEGSQDPEYLQRRARNNAAAKRSRDLRKIKEVEKTIRVAYLKHQNRELRYRCAALSPRRCLQCNNFILTLMDKKYQ